MDMDKLKKTIESIDNYTERLERFKNQILNYYIAYLTDIKIEKQNLQRLYSNDQLLAKKMQQELEWDSLYLPVDSAAKILAVVQQKLNEEDIKEFLWEEEGEFFALFPFATMWDLLYSLEPMMFFIGVLAIIRYVNNDSRLAWFFKNKIFELFNNNGLIDVYNQVIENKTVFVAMWFDGQMSKARECIKSAISDNGFLPVIIDEKEHNNQIVPEILHEIRNSAFMVADITGHRNGVYYEAGYAEALGKRVIMTCKDSSFDECHFDVRQKNIVIWKDEAELYERLFKRIKVSICDAG